MLQASVPRKERRKKLDKINNDVAAGVAKFLSDLSETTNVLILHVYTTPWEKEDIGKRETL